jgi:hypothetical protein
MVERVEEEMQWPGGGEGGMHASAESDFCESCAAVV